MSLIINLSKKTKTAKKAFTLIELLVVIAILGILATIAIASFTTAQAKGRDARRKADLDAIKKALELAKTDTSGGSYYPDGTTGYGGVYYSDSTCTPASPNLVCKGYIRALPTDPTVLNCRTGIIPAGFAGYYCYVPTAGTGPSQWTAYTLTACLENNNDTGGNTLAKPASGEGAGCPGPVTSRIYQVTNP